MSAPEIGRCFPTPSPWPFSPWRGSCSSSNWVLPWCATGSPFLWEGSSFSSTSFKSSSTHTSHMRWVPYNSFWKWNLIYTHDWIPVPCCRMVSALQFLVPGMRVHKHAGSHEGKYQKQFGTSISRNELLIWLQMAKACYIYFALKIFDMLDTVRLLFYFYFAHSWLVILSGALRSKRQTKPNYVPPPVPPHLNATPCLGRGHLCPWLENYFFIFNMS